MRGASLLLLLRPSMSFLPGSEPRSFSAACVTACPCCPPPPSAAASSAASSAASPPPPPLPSPCFLYDTHCHTHLSRLPACPSYPDLSVRPVLQSVTPADVSPPGAPRFVGLHPWYLPKARGVPPYAPARLPPPPAFEAYLAENVCSLGDLPPPPAANSAVSLLLPSPPLLSLLHSLLTSPFPPPALRTVTWLRPLLSSPSPLIGEIGLDKPAAKKDLKYVLASPSYPPLPPAAKQLLSPLHAQVAAFSAQLVLCGERRGLCSVHSVKASPYVAALLRYFFAGEGARAGPRGVVMHSFSGDREDYRELREFEGESGVRVYFGYSGAVSGRSRSRDVWEEVSRDRVLLESDAVDERGQKRALVEGVREIGRIWGRGDMEVVEAVNRNWEECGGLVEGAIALT